MGAKRLYSSIIQVGLIMAMAFLIFGSTAPTIAQSTPPNFDNPWDRGTTFSYGLGQSWANNWNWSGISDIYTVSNETGTPRCSATTSWQCLDDPQNAAGNTSRSDGNKTYIHIGTGGAVSFNITGNLASGQVRQGEVRMWCRSINNPNPLNPNVYIPVYGPSPNPGAHTFFLDDFGIRAVCPSGPNFGLISIQLWPFGGAGAQPTNLASNPNGPFLAMDIASYGIDVSTVEVSLYITGYGTACTGADFFNQIGCQIGSIFSTISTWLTWAANGIVFVFAWAGSFFAIAVGIFGLFVWLYNIPLLPFPIQLILSVYVTANIGVMIYELAALIRGSGSGG